MQKNGVEVSIREFGQAMERLAGYLDGLDSYIAGIIELYHENHIQ
jgi:hypothetical protein